MQDIKFRAWDISQEKMVPWEELQEYKIKTIADGVKNQIWMQYTGLKDIEGREIYKGDIVEGHADGLGKIVWQGACWTYEFTDSNTVSLDEICIWFGNNAQVIGNIYETPEFLTKDHV